MSRTDFAAKLKVSRNTLFEWEKGTTEPSAEVYIRLGNLAGYPKSIWFLQRAGVDISELSPAFSAFDKILTKRLDALIPDLAFGPPQQSGDESPRVPLLRDATRLRPRPTLDRDVEMWVTLPAGMVASEKTASCVRAPDDYMSPIFRMGDMVVVDGGERDWERLNGRIVAAYHSPRKRSRSKLPSGLYLRWLYLKGEERPDHYLESEEGRRRYAQRAIGGGPVSVPSQADSVYVSKGDPDWQLLGAVVGWLGRDRGMSHNVTRK